MQGGSGSAATFPQTSGKCLLDRLDKEDKVTIICLINKRIIDWASSGDPQLRYTPKYKLWSSLSVVPRPATSGHLLERQILGPYCRPTESETLKVEQKIVSTNPPGCEHVY